MKKLTYIKRKLGESKAHWNEIAKEAAITRRTLYNLVDEQEKHPPRVSTVDRVYLAVKNLMK